MTAKVAAAAPTFADVFNFSLVALPTLEPVSSISLMVFALLAIVLAFIDSITVAIVSIKVEPIPTIPVANAAVSFIAFLVASSRPLI